MGVAWALGKMCLSRLPAPPTMVLAVGAAAESCLVFLLLLAGAANRITFALAGVACLVLLLRLRAGAPRFEDFAKAPADRVTLWLAAAALTCYGSLYLINALAP